MITVFTHTRKFRQNSNHRELFSHTFVVSFDGVVVHLKLLLK